MNLALDDFGSGYSSFQYLADLPFSFLNIEGGLIRRVNEPRVRALVKGMQDTAAALGLTTLAEDVETLEVADTIREMGIDWAQGHYFYKPALSTLHRNPSHLAPRAITTAPVEIGRRLKTVRFGK